MSRQTHKRPVDRPARVVVYGINPVLEALRAERAFVVRIGDRRDERIAEIVRLASDRRVPVESADRDSLDAAAEGGRHQGVAAEVAALPDASIEEIVAARTPALVVVLDGVEDPHNLGAILRSVDASGANGVIRQERRAAALTPAAVKSSAGAAAHVRIATVVNIARAVESLNDAGIWTVGLAADATMPYTEIDLALPTALVLGAEGTGLRRLVRERCEVIASIPMAGHVDSLNVSVAAGVLLFEAARQRRGRWPSGGEDRG